MTKKLIGLFVITLLALPAYAMQPTMTSIDIGAMKGKEITCEGVIFNAYDSPSCAGTKGGCTEALVDFCKPLAFAQAVECTTAAPDKEFMGQLQSMHLQEMYKVEDDAIQSVKKQNPAKFDKIPVQELVKSDEFKADFNAKWMARPKVKVTGTLENCSACENCGPPSQCSLSQCKVKFVEPPK